MPTRNCNSVIWALISGLPSLRLLKATSFRTNPRNLDLLATLPVLFFRQINLITRLGSVFTTPQLIDYFATHLTQARRLGTSISFFLSRFALSFTQLAFTVESVCAPLPNLRVFSSLEPFFDAAWWLEREAAEGVGLFITEKADDRNLLLEYACVFKPLIRTFPSFGVSEVIFNSFLRLVEFRNLGLQQS